VNPLRQVIGASQLFTDGWGRATRFAPLTLEIRSTPVQMSPHAQLTKLARSSNAAGSPRGPEQLGLTRHHLVSRVCRRGFDGVESRQQM
jgi:hypothetical protein